MEIANETPATRIPLMLEIKYRKSYARTMDLGQLKNLSVTGAFLEHSQPMQENDKIQLLFTVGGRERTILAQIIWRGQTGSGVQFLPSNNRDIQIIDDLIYFVESKREARREIVAGIFKQAS